MSEALIEVFWYLLLMFISGALSGVFIGLGLAKIMTHRGSHRKGVSKRPHETYRARRDDYSPSSGRGLSASPVAPTRNMWREGGL